MGLLIPNFYDEVQLTNKLLLLSLIHQSSVISNQSIISIDIIDQLLELMEIGYLHSKTKLHCTKIRSEYVSKYQNVTTRQKNA